jgi:sulfofructose kinase
MPLDIIGVGYACVDYLVKIPRLPGWEDRVVQSDFGRQGGGPVGTAIYAAARLGSRVGLVDQIGDDDFGAFIRNDFAAAGVDLGHLRVAPGAVSPFTVVLVSAETGQRSFLINRGGAASLTEPELDPDYFAGAAFVHLDGIQPAAALGAARLARRLGVEVSLDGSDVIGDISPIMRELVPLTDVLIAARSFAEKLTGESDPARMARAMLDHGPRLAVVTLAEEGSVLAAGDEIIRQPGFRVSVVDTTGAGDVYHGAFLHGLVQGWPLARVQEHACLVAALKCTRLGGRAAIPTPAEVEAARSRLESSAAQ